jgi:RNA polymerase sigma-70 factor (ECF subfamily)
MVDQLVQRCRRGEPRAFSELFSQHKELVYRYIYKMLGSGAPIDELIQDTFIEIARSIGSFNEKAQLSTWIYRITANVCMRYLRQKHRKSTQMLQPNEIEIEQLTDNGEGSGEAALLKKQTRELINQALGRLDAKKRTVLVLHDMEGVALKDVAEIVGIPLGTVQTRLFHARAAMKKYLSKSI